MNPLSANPSSFASLSRSRLLLIKDPILVVIWLPGTGKISVSISFLAVIVTKPKYVLILYLVTDLLFKCSVKPHMLTLLNEVDKIGQSDLHVGSSATLLEVLDLKQNWNFDHGYINIPTYLS